MKVRIIAAFLAVSILSLSMGIGCNSAGTTASTSKTTTTKATVATAPTTPCATTTAVWATPTGAGMPPTPEQLKAAEFQGIDMPRITAQTLKTMIDSKTPVVLIDSRLRDLYSMGHLKGSINLPNDDALARLKLICPNELVVFLCD